MPDKDTIQKTIQAYDDFATQYAEASFQDPMTDQLGCFIKYLQGKKVLEIGCGAGRDLRFLVAEGFEATGIDSSAKLLEIAKKNVPQAKFYKMDMREIDFPAGGFDGIWACASFLHIPKRDAKQTVLKFKNILSSGGIFYNSVKVGNKEEVVPSKQDKNFKRFFASYTLEEFKKLHEESGFEIISMEVDKKINGDWIDLFAKKK